MSIPAGSSAIPTTVHVDERFVGSLLVRAAGIALVGSIAGALAVRGIAGVVVDLPSALTPPKPASVISLTVLGVLAATGFALLLNRVSARPAAGFRSAVPIALVVSLVPDAAIWLSSAYGGTARASTVLPLVVMHVVVADVCLATIPRPGVRAGR